MTKTLLGHCLHLNRREVEAVAAAVSRVVHCPVAMFISAAGYLNLSNSSSEEFQSVFARLLRAELSTCHVVRSATETQNVGRCYEAAVRLLGPAEAFYLSTSGAARALGKSDTIGPVKVGRDADLMLGDLIRIHPLNEDALFELPADDVVALRIYRDRPAATEASCAQGSCVFEQGPHHD